MNNRRIVFVTGGQRSGKSVFAEKMALTLSPSPLYVATAQVHDDELRKRVDAHKQRRGPQWITFESPINVADVPMSENDVALFDCVTLWATNCFFHFNENIEEALQFMKDQADALIAKGASIIFVTNEVGLGGVSPNAMQRRFADLQGSINQYVASLSTEAHMIVSGIDVIIKP